MADLQEETQAYLAKIRKTIQDSKRLMEEADLRLAETDRLLASQGLTRDQVRAFRFTDEQREVVNRELERRGMAPLSDEPLPEPPTPPAAPHPSAPRPASSLLRPGDLPADAAEMQGDAENRRRKFSAMMHACRL